MPEQDLKFSDDFLEGACAIACFVYNDPERVRTIYYLYEKCRIPCFKMGATICARKSTIIEWIKSQEERCDAGTAKKGKGSKIDDKA